VRFARTLGLAVLLSLLLVLLGAAVGLAVVGVHQSWPLLGLGVAAVVAVLVALPQAWWSRLPFAVGFAVVVVLAMVPRAEGDYLVGSDAPGYALLVLTLALVLAAVVTLPRPPSRRRADPAGRTTDSLR